MSRDTRSGSVARDAQRFLSLLRLGYNPPMPSREVLKVVHAMTTGDLRIALGRYLEQQKNVNNARKFRL